MKLEKKAWYDGRLQSWILTIRRLQLGIGWVIQRSGAEWPFAVNRGMSWREDRAVCVSILRLRVGFKLLR